MWIECGMSLINMDKVKAIYICDEIDSHDGIKYWHIMTDTEYCLDTFEDIEEAYQKIGELKSLLNANQ